MSNEAPRWVDSTTLRDASIVRMRTLSLGDPVTNVCAGENNPSLHAFFVAYQVKSRKNRYGLVHKSHWAKCTDKKGKFWDTDINVVYPGHLDAPIRSELFAPVWESLYGAKPAAIDVRAAASPSSKIGEGGQLP
ncbi:hypothetical protein J2W34_000095 [Variovorax boronicumulans]|uniref:hypothetical protein n=1 Tax=Variovorax boronicumulans TaxID=436515 RepID=UPI0027838EF9|nr:hypothetical protein [Variovorax boronicumulans]MDQ0068321.1 hypothetical protein [Variovorax boronicumulans]